MDGLITPSRILALSVVAGIALPPVAELLRPLVFPSLFCLLLASLLQIDLDAVTRSIRHDGVRVGIVTTVQMVAIPLIVIIAHRFLPVSGQWSELMFLTACAGAIFGSPAFSSLCGLDSELTLKGVVAGNLLMPVTLPLLIPQLFSGAVEIDYGIYATRLLVFLLIPFVAAVIYQRCRGPVRAPRAAAQLRWLVVFFLAVFAIGIMDGIGQMLLFETARVLKLLGICFASHGLFFLVATLLCWRLGRKAALTAGLLASYRNLGLLLAVGAGFLPADFIVYVALWQIPMYVMPLVLAPLIQRAIRSSRTDPSWG